MDIGIVASRYAKALLRYATEQKEEDGVYAEMQVLSQHFCKIPQLNASLINPVLTNAQKVKLLATAATPPEGTASKSTHRFVELVVDNNRTELMHFIATAYLRQYEQQKNMTTAHLTVAQPITEEAQTRLRKLVEQRTQCSVQMQTQVNPELEAGFVLEYADYRMDASLRGQFERLRRELK